MRGSDIVGLVSGIEEVYNCFGSGVSRIEWEDLRLFEDKTKIYTLYQ